MFGIDVWRAKRKLDKLAKFNSKESYLISHLEAQIEGLRKSLASYFESSSKSKYEILSKLRDELPSILSKIIDEIDRSLNDLKQNENIIDFLANNSFVEPKLEQSCAKYKIKVNDLLNKRLLLDPNKVRDIENSFREMLCQTRNKAQELEKYIRGIRNTYWTDEHAQKIQHAIELMHISLEALSHSFKELALVLKKEGFKGKLTLSRRKFLGVLGKTMAYSAVGGTAMPTMFVFWAAYLKYEASKLPENNKNGLAIFVSSPRNEFELFLKRFEDIYINRIQLAFGFKAMKILRYPTRNDFLEIFNDERVQNFAILGHGNPWNVYLGRGFKEHVNFFDFFYPSRDGKLGMPIKKSGFFLKHSCGVVMKTPTAKELSEFIEESRVKHPEYFEDDKIMGVPIKDWFEAVMSGKFVMGYFSFPKNHIASWQRISDPTDFIFNPFHEVNLFDKFKDKLSDSVISALKKHRYKR